MSIVLISYALIGSLFALFVIVNRKQKKGVSDAFILFASLLIWPVIVAITVRNIINGKDVPKV